MAREYAAGALSTVALPVERAWTILMIGTCIALGALTFKVIWAEKLWVSDRFSAARRAITFSIGFAASFAATWLRGAWAFTAF